MSLNRERTAVLRLARELAKAAEESADFVALLIELKAVPRVAVPFEEIRDKWNRIRYRMNLDDGSDVVARFTKPLNLGQQYIYLGTETNPMPVDPLIIDAANIATFAKDS